jgi:hypothetical protein
MNIFNILIAFICFLFPFNIEKSNIKESPDLDLKAILRGRYNLCNNTGPDNYYYYLVEVKLINNADSSIKFLTYDCSTAGNIVVDNKYIEVCAKNCGGNSKTVITLKSKQEFSISIILKTKQGNNLSQIKIGLILLSPNRENFSNFPRLLDSCRISLKNVLWSKPFSLSMYGGSTFEIR